MLNYQINIQLVMDIINRFYFLILYFGFMRERRKSNATFMEIILLLPILIEKITNLIGIELL